MGDSVGDGDAAARYVRLLVLGVCVLAFVHSRGGELACYCAIARFNSIWDGVGEGWRVSCLYRSHEDEREVERERR